YEETNQQYAKKETRSLGVDAIITSGSVFDKGKGLAVGDSEGTVSLFALSGTKATETTSVTYAKATKVNALSVSPDSRFVVGSFKGAQKLNGRSTDIVLWKLDLKKTDQKANVDKTEAERTAIPDKREVHGRNWFWPGPAEVATEFRRRQSLRAAVQSWHQRVGICLFSRPTASIACCVNRDSLAPVAMRPRMVTASSVPIY